jgi:2-oxoglutarate dehydrogenase E1 component
MVKFQDSFLSGGNIDFIEALYARYLEDPAAVDPSWRELFAHLDREGRPIFPRETNGKAHAQAVEKAVVVPLPSAVRAAQSMSLQARVDQTIYAFRLRGHLLAQLDPLGRPRPALEHVADFGMVSESHFTDDELEQQVSSHNILRDNQQVPLKEVLRRLRSTYCHNLGVEFMHLFDSRRRRWLQDRLERNENRTDFTVEEQRRILTKLSYAEGFESFLHTKYVGA